MKSIKVIEVLNCREKNLKFSTKKISTDSSANSDRI